MKCEACNLALIISIIIISIIIISIISSTHSHFCNSVATSEIFGSVSGESSDEVILSMS